jgi:two-component system cell cycle response regulator
MAWERLLNEDFDLAVLSLWLDDGEGLRLASRMRAQTSMREVPVLLVADADQRNQVLRGFDIGANDHVLRPVDPNELRARARNQIRRKRYQERLRADLQRSLEMAVTDSLTGLRNRRYVMRHLEGLLRSGGATLLLIDVDRFKSVNDTYGHAFGDAVLREVAERLRLHLRAVDVVARFGGEEFVVAMAPQPADDAGMVAERLRLSVCEQPIRVGDRALGVSISIGVAVAVPDCTVDQLAATADIALYRAKANGRNRVEIATPADWVPDTAEDG